MVSTATDNTFENGFFWNNYKSIESDFITFLDFVPYYKSNLKMYSPKLTGLLLRIGGYVDSAFKEMANYFEFDEILVYDRRKGKMKREKNVIKDIIDACGVFESIYKLSSNNGGVLIAKLDSGDQSLHPFGGFSVVEKPEWWDAYNKVKHEYSLHFKKASIDKVLEGLAAAFLLNVVHYPSVKLLWQLGYLKTGAQAGAKTGRGFTEIYLSETHADHYMVQAASELKPLNIGIRIETPIFLYVHP